MVPNADRPSSVASSRSLRWGVAATTFSQVYVAVLGIVVLPLYLRYLGSEAYGLVGFFALLLGLTPFLDMGLSSALMREAARFRGGASDASELLALFSILQRAFLVIALGVALLVILSSGMIATSWLHVQKLSLTVVTQAVALMGLCLAARWLAGLYRGVVTGFEQLVWLSGFNAVMATLRFILIIPLMAFVSASILTFFWFQLAVSVLELTGLLLAARRQLPSGAGIDSGSRWFGPLRKTLGFSSSLAVATFAWLLITQTDKILLSNALPLAAYGHFTLAVLLASSVGLLAAPIGQAVLPRLTRLVAESSHAEALALYRRTTHVLCVVAAPLTLTIWFFAEQILLAWTGQAHLAHEMAPVLKLYAAGNAVLAVAAMPYFLQYAKGTLRLHVVGTVLLAILLVPCMVYAIDLGGAIGSGVCWLGAMTLYLLVWTPIAHRRFARGLEWTWLLQDIVLVALPAVVVTSVAWWAIQWPAHRLATTLTFLAVTVIATAACTIASEQVRGPVTATLRSLLRKRPA